MKNLTRVTPGTNKYPAEDFNSVVDVAERMQRLMVAGATISQGPSGTMLHVDQGVEILIGTAREADGGYPSFNNDRYVFPVLLSIGPNFDASAPTADFDFSTEQVPEVQVFNVRRCWIFEDTPLIVVKVNGFYWTWHTSVYSGVAAADIAMGNLGNVTVMGITISARAKFGPTVNTKAVNVYHDMTEWVIAAEQCP